MKITKIYEDDWQGVVSNDKEYECNELDQVIKAVNALNGKNKTLIELIVNEDLYLTIGGGNAGRYVCYLTENDMIFNLTSPNADGQQQISIVAGGQQGDFKSTLCLNIDMIIKAATYFFENGKISPDLTWER